MLPLLVMPRLLPLGGSAILATCCLLLFHVPIPSGKWLALLLGSFIWANCRAHYRMLPLHDRELALQGTALVRAAGLNIAQKLHRYPVILVAFNGRPLPRWRQFPIWIRWPQESATVLEGQIWQLRLQLRPVHGRLNQGGFDSQRWAVEQGILFSGVGRQPRLLRGDVTLRQRLAQRVTEQLSGCRSSDILWSLAFGERSLVTPEHRRLFQESGLAHLMAISGLHISLAASFGWGVVRLLQAVLPLAFIGPSGPLLAGALTASIYLWISGANPPALRAWLALIFWIWLRWHGYRWLPSQLLLRIAALLLLGNPLMMLSASFWLSCTAVAALSFWHYWFPLPKRLRGVGPRWLFPALHLQLGLLLLLLPLQGALFHGVNLFSWLANMVAVPLVSLIVIPAILAALATFWFPPLAHLFWRIADGSLTSTLEVISCLPVCWLPMSMVVSGVSLVIWMLLPTIRLGIWRTHPATLLLLWLLFYPQRRRNGSEWRVDLLDVGHGLAVVVSHGNQAILYDTATSWPGGSMAEQAILPHLRWRGLQLAGVILSHDDRDHAGGWPTIQSYYPKAWLRTPTILPGALPCRAGESWWWHGLHFEVLWPKDLVERAQNIHSCTLRIDDGKNSILLTGDLDRKAEQQLVKEGVTQLPVTALLVPHHGSSSSSSLPFIKATDPQVAIVSVSRYNQWHLPSKKVKALYRQRGIIWWSTAQSGQISLQFSPKGWRVRGYREHLAKRWFHSWFGRSPGPEES